MSLNDITSYPPNGSWNNTDVFPNYFNFDYDSTDSKNPAIELLGRDDISGVENPCHLITTQEAASYQNIAFQLELIVQPIFVIIGFGFNTIAINILRR